MRPFAVFTIALALFVTPIVGDAASYSKAVKRYDGDVNPDSYIVKLKDGVSKEEHLAWLEKNFMGTTVTASDWDSSIFNAYSALLDHDALESLLQRPDVDYVEEDGVVQGSAYGEPILKQTNAPWGLGRISQDSKLSNQNSRSLNFTYTYPSSAGIGVDIYFLDTGIYLAHNEFGGRAVWGATFGGYPRIDDNGHGTHVAGIAGGKQYGAAKRARLIAVKVLDSQNRGFVSNFIAGVNFVSQRVTTTRRPSIINMSLSSDSGSVSFDQAVAAVVRKGVHVVVAAGNKNTDASKFSPARSPVVVAVGATTISDERAGYSNYGPVVDIFAPGSLITSSYIGAVNRTNVLSGTSMAAPHVSGLIAAIISRDGNLTPGGMALKVKALALKNLVKGLPAKTANLLARNGQK